jgi:hypothetical protein
MIKYTNNKINKIPELKIGDGKELKKFEWSGWAKLIAKLIFKKEFKFTWRW